jgi:hypothetical protein
VVEQVVSDLLYVEEGSCGSGPSGLKLAVSLTLSNGIFNHLHDPALFMTSYLISFRRIPARSFNISIFPRISPPSQPN